ncbi:MAG: META domain-containing protein [Caulobacter sp.]|nr:META domain-containing protein [Caulobacter sp.]
MEPEKKLARDLTILGVVILAAMPFVFSELGFRQRWIVESRDGVAARADEVSFRHKRRRGDRVALHTACGVYNGRYSHLAGRVTISDLSRPPPWCGDDAALIADLNAARRYRFVDGKLRLETDQGHVLLLRRAA